MVGQECSVNEVCSVSKVSSKKSGVSIKEVQLGVFSEVCSVGCHD